MSVGVVDHDGAVRFCNYADPGIKLFGRDIPVTQEASDETSLVSTEQLSSLQDEQPDYTIDCKEPMDVVLCKSENGACVEVGNKGMGSFKIGETGPPIENGVPVHDICPKVEESQAAPIALEKTPKKLLPCPQCQSLDTKFCYFNNYNVNQPRHFCRKCQRYWTAGGTLRNVPVGAGRRKNKHSQKHGIVPDASQARSSAPDTARHRFCSSSGIAGSTVSLKPRLHVLPVDAQPVSTLDSPTSNSRMLSSGQESPLCKSMAATTLGIQENAALQILGGVYCDGAVAAAVHFAVGSKHTSEVEDSASSVKISSRGCQASSDVTIAAGIQQQEGELTVTAGSGNHQIHLGELSSPNIHGAVWPGSSLPSGSSLNPTTAIIPDSEKSPTTSFSLPAPNGLACNGTPGGFWPGFTWPYMNPAMWGALPLEWPGPWTMPLYPPGAAAALLPLSNAGNALPKQQPLERSQPEKCLWVPKTLRIDDPLNAARSSIWTTLGLGDGPLSSPAQCSTFQLKLNSKEENEAVSTNRFSNPAALSRSVAFQENS
ncbi:hypothetical protein L7F22_004536 [Adiantum nelumboides]|nr:hypothetical protein [Adiantum nelumboides]